MPAQLTFRVAIYDALTSGATMGLVGLLGEAMHQPWLFPSLGPTIFMQTVRPEDRASTPWSVLVGHAVGVGAAYAAVFLCHAQASPSGLSADGPSIARVLATVLAITGTMTGQRLFRALHPPAAATTMLISLGSFPPNGRTLAALAAGVALVCLVGDVVRIFRRGLGERFGWPED